jgi:hypothetical protein
LAVTRQVGPRDRGTTESRRLIGDGKSLVLRPLRLRVGVGVWVEEKFGQGGRLLREKVVANYSPVTVLVHSRTVHKV